MLLAAEVLNGVAWSEQLDPTFRRNYIQDPTITWQYFGSATGFLRNFPGISVAGRLTELVVFSPASLPQCVNDAIVAETVAATIAATAIATAVLINLDNDTG